VFVAPARIGRIELEREAKIAATRIGAQLQGEPGTLIDAFARPALAPHLNRIFEDLGYAHRVLRYEFYDAASNLTFTSGSTALRLAPEVEDVARGFPAAATAVTLHNGSNAAVSQFAVLTIPTRMSGEPDGTLIVYLDQSEQAKALSRYFGLIAAVTCWCLVRAWPRRSRLPGREAGSSGRPKRACATSRTTTR
jgi:hypothetical protein